MSGDLQELAHRHLWMHFTRMGAYVDHEIPVIVRGEGCYVYDEHGKRYLDGLSALFCVNAGHGRAELGDAGARQARELGFYTNWGCAHPRSIELAARIAGLAPGSLNCVFFTSGGSEAVESAWKLAKAYHAARGERGRFKLIARNLAYHGTSMGALAATGLPALRAPFEPLTPGGHHVPHTGSYRWPENRDPLWAADAIEEAILFEGPETVAAAILEPVQNSGGCLVPQEGYFQRVREICDRHGVLLISDEVICSWGARAVFAEAELVLKVKEPQPGEVALLRKEQTLFTYLHLAAEPSLARGLQASGATCIAYETVEDAHGNLPLLAPMSEVAGKLATQAGAFMLEKPLGGRGILLGGVPGVAAATVLVIGGGVVGMNAAIIAIGMQADVFVFDRSIDRLRELEVTFGGRASTVFSSTLAIEEMLPIADLVIGAVLIHGGRAPT